MHTTICGKAYADSLLGWIRGNLGALHAKKEHCEQCNICRSPKESSASCNQVQTTRILRTGVLLQHDNAHPHPACPTVATIQDQAFECLPHLPLVTFMSLDRSKRRWEASLSGPTKRCSRQCMSGCALSQKTFFLEVSNALLKHWNTCKVRNGDYIEK
jgi:hypothetical protein